MSLAQYCAKTSVSHAFSSSDLKKLNKKKKKHQSKKKC